MGQLKEEWWGSGRRRHKKETKWRKEVKTRSSVVKADWSIYFCSFFELLLSQPLCSCLPESHSISHALTFPVFISHLSDRQTCRWNKTRPCNLFCCFCQHSFLLLHDDIHLSAASASLKWIHLPLSCSVSLLRKDAVWQQMLKDEMRIGVVMTQWVQLYSRNIKSDSWLPLRVSSLFCPSFSLTAIIKI